MTTRLSTVGLSIDGGYDTEQGPSAGFRQRADGLISIPWLLEAQNIVYLADGWFQKMPGASNVNASATGASDHVNGIFDYWRSGTGTAPSQQRILYAGTALYSESGGTLTAIKTGLEAQKMPCFAVMNDTLVIATTSSVDVPMTWDQTTFANLGGSPPAFKVFLEHKQRGWGFGVDALKSRAYYTVLGNQADWTGAGSGSIDVTPNDGDVLTGARSHNNELIFFKGPNTGSIQRLTGSSPTGTDAFALDPFIRGVGSTNHQGILEVAGDLVFPDDNGLHSLSTTAAFADYTPEFLSVPIATDWVKQLNHDRFPFIWGANFRAQSQMLWTVSRAGATTHDMILGLDYRFKPARFFRWPAYAVASLAMVRDTSRETVPWAGTYTGRAMRMNRAARDLAGTAYTARVLLPYLSFGSTFVDKGAMKADVGFAPKGETTFVVGWQRDGQTQQTHSVTQAGTASLGASSDQFLLDSDVLAGGRYLHEIFDLGGEFKELQLEVTQGGLDEDVEVHSFGLQLAGAGVGEAQVLG